MKELEYKKMIYKKANDVKDIPGLNDFIIEIIESNQDYGTIVYGCVASMIAAFNVVNRSKAGGITGFQAGCVGREIMQKFLLIKSPYKIVEYEKMLFPQYAKEFQKTIPKEVWDDLKKKAKEKVLKHSDFCSPDVLYHWKKVSEGWVPFGYEVKEE